MKPLISVIIPSGGKRPKLLQRAINSAFTGRHEIEVLVIVNGPNSEAFPALSTREDRAVKTIRIGRPGVSNARNIGLQSSSGTLIRFLDDDDYLIPNNAAEQYDLMLQSESDLCSGRIAIKDENEIFHGESRPLTSPDPYCDLLAGEIPPMPFAHVYRADAIKKIIWDTTIDNAEDVDWLHRVARSRELKWLIYNQIVGVWFQHSDNDRLSYTSINNQATRVSAESIKSTFNLLEKSNRINIDRKKSVGTGLWRCAHKAFYLSPIYWSKIIKTSMKINKDVVKTNPIYLQANKLCISPLLIDWLMIPKRYINHYSRALVRKMTGRSHIRHL